MGEWEALNAINPTQWGNDAGWVGGKLGGGAKDIWNWMENHYNAGILQPTKDTQQSRADQRAAIPTIQEWALTGKGPSAAQAQLEQARGQNVAQAESAAKSTTGLNTGARQAMAAEGEATANAAAGNESAQLRAQEQQNAMGAYLGMLDAERRGDIATYQAMAQQYAAATQQNAETARAESKNRSMLGMGALAGLGGMAGL